jgi:hypothetical protein
MGMRSCAFLLMLSLVSPAVLTAACELACLQAQHHRNADALASPCHGHAAPPAPVAVSAADRALCHDEAPLPSAIVKATPQFASMPSEVTAALPAEFHMPDRVFPRGHLWVVHPALLRITSQLRI